MEKIIILTNVERIEITIFLRMLLNRTTIDDRQGKISTCNVQLLEQYIKNLERDT